VEKKSMNMTDLTPFVEFIGSALNLIDNHADREDELLPPLGAALGRLISSDTWLPAEFAVPHKRFYRQYLLYADRMGRFSVVNFVWGPGQRTPVHNHCVWGLVGLLRGAEISTPYQRSADGALNAGKPEFLTPGRVVSISPRTGDIHSVANGYADRVSMSVHIYGGDIGSIHRSVFDVATGDQKHFISGYSNGRPLLSA
jgi:predicted metal-dependent enzyme (double-stranded beta helix superfamily)